MNISLHIWDMAGENNFQTIQPMYIKGTQVLFLAFDVSNRETFEQLDQWLDLIEKMDLSNQNIKRI